MTIYYCYERTTGYFAGSGITEIDNDTHGSTVIPAPSTGDSHRAVWTDDHWRVKPIWSDPNVVSRFQAKAALAGAGLLDTVEAMMEDAPLIARLAWQDAQEFRRDSPTLLVLGAQLGLTDEQLNQLFDVARNIEA